MLTILTSYAESRQIIHYFSDIASTITPIKAV
jgi:hypothetical protein